MTAKAKDKGVKFLLPTDVLAVREFDKDAPFEEVDAYKLADDQMGLDIGPKTIQLYVDALKGAKTVVWNGPMGVFEFPNFAGGTRAIARTMAEMKDAVTIVGGGDSAAAVDQMGFSDKLTHISTGGGASLMFMEGLPLPAIQAANDK